MRKINKLNAVLAVCLVLTLMVGTFAYFTDRVDYVDASLRTMDENGVNIEPEKDPTVTPDDPSNPDKPGGTDSPENWEDDVTPDDPSDDLTQWWAYLNSRAIKNFNPADRMTLSFKMANKGELDVKMRETFIVTISNTTQKLTFNGNDPKEFKLCTGTKAGAFGGYAADATTGMTFTKISDTKYKVTVADTTIAKGTSAAKSYFLVFDGSCGNGWQGAQVTIDYLAEAMQSNGDWITAATGSLTMGGQDLTVVPAAPAN